MKALRSCSSPSGGGTQPSPRAHSARSIRRLKRNAMAVMRQERPIMKGSSPEHAPSSGGSAGGEVGDTTSCGFESARSSQRVVFTPESRDGSARLIAKCKRRSMALAAGLATIFQDRDRRACALPALPTRDLVGGPLRITEGGPLRITGGQKQGRKMHGSMHVSGTYTGEKRGRSGGGS